MNPSNILLTGDLDGIPQDFASACALSYASAVALLPKLSLTSFLISPIAVFLESGKESCYIPNPNVWASGF